MSRTKKPLLIAFITIFLDLLGFGIIIPIQPFFTKSLGASPTIITLLGASYSLMQFLFAPFWGSLSDRLGRRPIMLSSIAIACVGYFIFASAESLWVLFFARMLSGFGNANLGTAQAIISDSTTGEERAKGMGLIGAAFGLGFIFGPAIGAFLGQISPRTPLYAAGVLSAINLLLTYILLPETKKTGAPPKSIGFLLRPSVIKRFAISQNVKSIFWVSFFSVIAFSQLEQIIALFIEDIWVPTELGEDERIKLAARLTGYYLLIVGIVAAVIQGGLIGRLNKRFTEVGLIRTGLLIILSVMILIPFIGSTGSFALLLLSAPYLSIGTSILNPSKSSLLSQSVPANMQGTILGINQSFASMGRVLGPATAGLMFEYSINLPFYAAGILILPALFLSWRLSPASEVS